MASNGPRINQSNREFQSCYTIKFNRTDLSSFQIGFRLSFHVTLSTLSAENFSLTRLPLFSNF